jgi:hypothetical protein
MVILPALLVSRTDNSLYLVERQGLETWMQMIDAAAPALLRMLRS